MQSADVYMCIAANLPPTEQWVLRQVCAAWRHHFRKQPPQLCLVITRQWTLKACPSSLLPQVSQKHAGYLVYACRCVHIAARSLLGKRRSAATRHGAFSRLALPRCGDSSSTEPRSISASLTGSAAAAASSTWCSTNACSQPAGYRLCRS